LQQNLEKAVGGAEKIAKIAETATPASQNRAWLGALRLPKIGN
jgi:hypothetical protein